MAKEDIFRFVHIRPPYQSKDSIDKKSKAIENDSTSELLKEAEKMTEEEGVPFEKSRVVASKKHIYSNNFIIKDDFYIGDHNIDNVKKLVKKKQKKSDFDLFTELVGILPIKSDNANLLNKQIEWTSSKLWDSYFALRLVPHKRTKELLPKSIFWIKIFELFKYRDNEDELTRYVNEFEDFKPALESKFHINPLLIRKEKITQSKNSDLSEERKNKLKDLAEQIKQLSQIKVKLVDIILQKESTLQSPIQPSLPKVNDSNQIDLKTLEKYDKELAKYRGELKSARFFNSKDFSKNDKLILEGNQIDFLNQSQIELKKRIDYKISSLLDELNNLSFVERIQIKNGRFVKTLKKINP